MNACFKNSCLLHSNGGKKGKREKRERRVREKLSPGSNADERKTDIEADIAAPDIAAAASDTTAAIRKDEPGTTAQNLIRMVNGLAKVVI